MARSFILLIFLLLNQILLAQGMLVLQDQDSEKRYVFEEGEALKIKLKGSGEVLKGEWHDAGSSALVINEKVVKLQDIRWIDVSSKEKGIWVLRKGQDLLLLAGAGYFTVAHVNILIEHGKLGVDPQVAKTSAILVAGGLICRVLDRTFRKRKIRVDEGSKFSVTIL